MAKVRSERDLGDNGIRALVDALGDNGGSLPSSLFEGQW